MVNARMKRLAVVPAIAIMWILLAQGPMMTSQSVPEKVAKRGNYKIITPPGKNEVLLINTRTGQTFLLVGSGLDRRWTLVAKGPRAAAASLTLITDALGIVTKPEFPASW